MIVYIGNSKELSDKLLELINEFTKVTRRCIKNINQFYFYIQVINK